MKKKALWLLAIVMIFSMSLPAFGGVEQTGTGGGDYDLALYVGSPLTISGGVIKALDPDNPNVAPFIHKDRTLVPLRAIAEHFGAAVTYDPAKKAAIIEYDGITTTFFAGKNTYTQASPGNAAKTYTYDTEMLIRESRSMVPFRVICEKVLAKKVDYSQSIITVSTSVIDLGASTALKADIKNKIGQAVKVTSRAQLETLIGKKLNEYNTWTLERGTMESAVDLVSKETTGQESAVPAPGTQDATNTPNTQEHSTTNLQVEGIDEADVVKTDGKFIYIAGGGFVKIIKADKGKTTLADTIKMPIDPQTGQNINITELYIDEGRLVLLGSFWQGGVAGDDAGGGGIMPMEKSMAIYPPIWQGKNYVYCGVYSVDSLGQAALLKEVSMEGSLLSSRKNGDVVYLMANKYFYSYGAELPADLIPTVKDTAAGPDFRELPLDRILCYPDSISPQYLMLAAIDIRNTDQASTVEAILGSGSTVYMNDRSLYVAQGDYSDALGESTAITRFSVSGTKLGFAGGGKVKGSLLNQFSMDEFEGNLRVATTAWGQTSTNSVYVLDANLNQIGALENLAPGERIFAVRFMGGSAYIVTFRQVDPLFVLDLSVPTAPKVTGELKVPGFSNFLYPIGENLILGVGQGMEDLYSKDSSGREIVVGTRQTGIKFSIFDVSDQGKPKELHTYTVGDNGSYSEILYNHKALLLDQKDNMLAFDATLQEYDYDNASGMSDYFNGAVVLTYDLQKGFMETGRISSNPSLQEGPDIGYYSNIRRLCTIGDVLYYVQDNQVRSFDLNSLTAIN